jgi:hypothetical protein
MFKRSRAYVAFFSPFPPYDSDVPLIGRVPTEGFLLGT